MQLYGGKRLYGKIDTDALRNGGISIITPSMNSSKHILETIHSIANQTYKNVEHIVIDGGSTDGTVDILKENEHLIDYWVSEKDGGMYEALKKGFAFAKGEYGCWLNADDLYYPWTCETVANIFKRHPSCNWLTGIETHLSEDRTPYIRLPHSFPDIIIRRGLAHGRAWGFIQQESTFFTMDLFRLAGGINTDYRLAGDFDLWRKMAQYARLYTILSPLGIFRHHPDQLSTNKSSYFKEVYRAGGKNAKWIKPVSTFYSLAAYIRAKVNNEIFFGPKPE